MYCSEKICQHFKTGLCILGIILDLIFERLSDVVKAYKKLRKSQPWKNSLFSKLKAFSQHDFKC